MASNTLATKGLITEQLQCWY